MISAQPEGYTILELMIVIVVSASMFITVAIAFGGRQQQIQFTQAVRDMDAQILDIINDVTTGYYDSRTIGCSIPNPSDVNERPLLDGSVVSGTSQGTNDDCVRIGKAIQLAPLVTLVSGEDPKGAIFVYNIVGRRNNGGSVNDLAAANPMAIGEEDIVDSKNLGGKFENIQLKYGLSITDVYNSSPTPVPIGMIGFFTSFTKSFNTPTDDDIILSNNQSVRYGAIPTTTLNQPVYEAISAINKTTDTNPAVSPEIFVDTVDSSSNIIGGVRTRAITICVKSPEGRRAAIVIGANGTTSTQVQFDNYDTGKCVS